VPERLNFVPTTIGSSIGALLASPVEKGTPAGPNIPVLAGKYPVTFNVNTGEYSFK